ncbi:TPA: DUF1297 domain-containing protein, partial [Candidatus Micrarchaeota archaeon]|nr:DUF1297 domain-containing protein [Candidatus Micrarchaeota archaeon]
MVSKRAPDTGRIIADYSPENLTIATIGSHSALEISRGAKQEGMKNLVVCQKGRESLYSKHYKTRKMGGREHGCVDSTLVLGKFSQMLEPSVQRKLRDCNSIFVPNRSFAVYVGYDGIENNFEIPIFGNRFLLRAEERDAPKNQYYLMQKAGIRFPRRFKVPGEIDRVAIIKTPEAKRSYERAFFLAKNAAEYEAKSTEMLQKKIITAEGLKNAVIEEFVLGAQFNFNFFHSPLSGETELMGIDTRRQTNLDGILRLPAQEQMEVLTHVRVSNIEVGHIAATLRESLLEKAFDAAERLVEACRQEYAPGIIGP